jgi:8-oxo-dGTP pyrophosphatase MutT (NUDIX family)
MHDPKLWRREAIAQQARAIDGNGLLLAAEGRISEVALVAAHLAKAGQIADDHVDGIAVEHLLVDAPPHLVGKALGGRYRGQKQRWFALRFTGTDADIRLDADDHPEFDAWRWVRLAEIPSLIVPFKRPIYEVLARDFARFAAPG